MIKSCSRNELERRPIRKIDVCTSIASSNLVELLVSRPSTNILLSIKADEVGEQHPFSESLIETSIGSKPTAVDDGDAQMLRVLETNEPEVSDRSKDSTETGDPLSCSENEGIVKEELSGDFAFGTVGAHAWPSLRGYGCSGFRFGLGGGMSIDLPVSALRST